MHPTTLRPPQGITLDVLTDRLRDCCDEYRREHPGHCEQDGSCGDGGHGCGRRGGCGGGWQNGICTIAGIEISNPPATRDDFRNGRMQCPQGIEIDVFTNLLDQCCDGYERDHPEHCEQHGCGHDNVRHGGDCGREGGCGGWINGQCIILDVLISDPASALDQYRNGVTSCPAGIDVEIYVRLLEDCCRHNGEQDGSGSLLGHVLRGG
jgi:hypothetical protein